MAVGRPPKPIEQHKRDGTRPGGRGVANPTPVLIGERGIPDRPTGLDPEARTVWDLVVKDLAEGRVLTTTDWPAVEAFAVQLGRARVARKALAWERKEHARRLRAKDDDEDDGLDPNPHAWLTQAGQKGSSVQNVYLQVEREAWKEARQIGDTLGLSPSARARLGLHVKGRPHGAGAERRGVPESPRRRDGLRVVGGAK